MSKERLLITFFTLIFIGALSIYAWLAVALASIAAKAPKILESVNSFKSGTEAFAKGDFAQAKTDFQNTHKIFNELDSLLSKRSYAVLEKLSTTKRLVWFTKNGVQIAANISKDTVGLADFCGEILPEKSQIFALHKLAFETRIKLLRGLAESPSRLGKLRADMREGDAFLAVLPDEIAFGLLGDDTFQKYKHDAEKLLDELNRALKIASIIPLLVGYPKPVEYLVLLQNNTELRPTGGFIGTIGGLKFEGGLITHFATEGVYNLDYPSEGRLNLPAPSPFVDYLAIKNLFLRDANWSPDFPTSAAKIYDLYKIEHSNAPELVNLPNDPSLIIAFTPTLIERLLEITGPVTVDGKKFSVENVIYDLEFEVEIGYLSKGIPKSDRKEIVGRLGEAIMLKLLALPQEKWSDVLNLFALAIKERHLILWARDPALEEDIIKNGWGGNVRQTDGDYLMVVDANLASLKTDPALKRTISWQIRPRQDLYETTITIHYDHRGDFDWKTTRYRSYTRIYVPKGSKLVSSKGALATDRPKVPGGISTTEELGKTVFGAFISVEPGEKHDLSVTYELPKYIVDQIHERRYTALIQKQSGTIGHDYEINWDFSTYLREFSSRGVIKNDLEFQPR